MYNWIRNRLLGGSIEYQCCSNWSQGWPNYVAHMIDGIGKIRLEKWLATKLCYYGHHLASSFWSHCNRTKVLFHPCTYLITPLFLGPKSVIPLLLYFFDWCSKLDRALMIERKKNTRLTREVAVSDLPSERSSFFDSTCVWTLDSENREGYGWERVKAESRGRKGVKAQVKKVHSWSQSSKEKGIIEYSVLAA